MRRQSAVTAVSIGYAIYCVAILSRGLLTSVARPRGHLSPWLICAILALLAFGLVAKQRWARGVGLWSESRAAFCGRWLLFGCMPSADLAAGRANLPSCLSRCGHVSRRCCFRSR
jgi:hypothetical protein